MADVTLDELERLAREYDAVAVDHAKHSAWESRNKGDQLARAVLSYVAADRQAVIDGQTAAKQRAEDALKRMGAA